MVEEMRKLFLEIVQHHPTTTPPTDEERNLLVVAFKNFHYDLRKSHTIARSIREKELRKGNQHQVELIEKFMKYILDKLVTACFEYNELLDKVLQLDNLPCGQILCFWKYKGDSYRNLSSIDYKNPIDNWKQKALYCYEKSLEEVNGSSLPATDPMLLGTALSYSVFYYEGLGQPEKACLIAKKAFDNALERLDELDEEHYRESTLVMQLLRDNLTLWADDIVEPDEP